MKRITEEIENNYFPLTKQFLLLNYPTTNFL